MGCKANGRLIYVLGCLLIAAFLIHFKPTAHTRDIERPLSLEFAKIDGWKYFNDIEMSRDIIEVLQLDDYLFRSYSNNNSIVSLYVGYYRTSDKLGAVHSPLVCYQGQGWEISAPKKNDVRSKSGIVNAETLIARKGQQQELIVYWYQASDMTSRGTFWQKINNFWAQIKSKSEANAFIRVSVSIKEENISDASIVAERFIRDFYPQFLRYITT
jgi:EpsI family protein